MTTPPTRRPLHRPGTATPPARTGLRGLAVELAAPAPAPAPPAATGCRPLARPDADR
ncbi:hypothetical protein [Kitasatospora purpeofusca]|uniref:hypothetical protein n=1 Tax=Kitasatospora purpeofusca TaxID=67352 RepID=UPI003830DDF0